MRILAIDTALGACSACILDAGAQVPLSAETMLMERGHAEALLPLVERVVAHAEGGFRALDRVAVTVGPGSFTGLRVGIAASRAIALAVPAPAVGVTTLSALLAPMVAAGHNRVMAAAIDARHGQIYVQAVAPGGRMLVPPRLMAVREALRLMGTGPLMVAGSGAVSLVAEALAAGLDANVAGDSVAPDIAWVARLGLAADPEQALPKPLYLRAPDATPQQNGRIARQ